MGVKKRIVVLASGRGSNFCALADAIQNKIILNAEVVGLVCNKKDAPVLSEAKIRAIPHFFIDANQFRVSNKFDRRSYEVELLKTLQTLKPDFILLAGYMLILGVEIIRNYPRKIINIHPSLLPKFRGLHAQKQALESGDSITGCTVHWVTEGLDEGEPILQAKIAILPNDTEKTLSERMLPIEHATYIDAIKLILKQN